MPLTSRADRIQKTRFFFYLAFLPSFVLFMTLQKETRSDVRSGIIKALAHPSRVRIAEALCDGERCVQDLTTLVGSDMSTVSKHLSIMKKSGWLEVEKRGLNQFYRLRCPCLLEFFRCVDLIDLMAMKNKPTPPCC
jgi:ArsR family transcriptional regulator